MNKMDELSGRESVMVFLAIVVSFAAIVLLLVFAQGQMIPPVVFGVSTGCLGLLAYQFSKAKFRLDLFEKRWLVYQDLVQFLSLMQQTGPNTKEVFDAAQGSFRGMGYHKSRALFDDDIVQLFDKLNVAFSWLSTYGKSRGNLSDDTWASLCSEHSTFIDTTVKKLPEYFNRYIYFGDYKR